jgi:ribonuclease Z
MLDIVFLGTGSGIPSKKRNPASIWFRYEDESMLWDCGEGTQRQMMMFRVSFMKISRIFITHWHADHWAGLIGLMQTMNMEGRTEPLYIYGPEAERFVDDILDLDYWGPRFKVIPKNVPFEGNDMNLVYHSKKFDIHSIPVNHTVPSVAYLFKEKEFWNVDIKKAEDMYGLKQGPAIGRLKKFKVIRFRNQKVTLEDVGIKTPGITVVYTGDTRACKNLETICKDVDMVIHDATFMDEKQNRMHSDARGAAQLAKKCNAKELVLTHFSRRYQDVKPLRDEAKKTFPKTRVAEDGMRITLKH